MPEKALRFFLGGKTKYHGLVFVPEPQWAKEHKERIAQLLPKQSQVQSWYDINSYLFDAIEIERYVIFFVIFLIVVAASFNMSVSLWVSIFRKTRELGVLKVLGLQPWQSILLFLLLAWALAGFGLMLGIPLGVLLSYSVDFLSDHWELMPAEVYKIGGLITWIRPLDILSILGSVFILSSLMALGPARSVWKLGIAEGLRFE